MRGASVVAFKTARSPVWDTHRGHDEEIAQAGFELPVEALCPTLQ